MTARLYPFAEAMALGLGVLRLSPEAFWAMTPRELEAALGGATGRAFRAVPSRQDLDALMQRFPDTPNKDRQT
ncbi:MAG: phage tail assembly chaperone [Rhodobiaceae bacterium]|nr:phage tail assembly chaperone [Rhodobiaceae bacterium]